MKKIRLKKNHLQRDIGIDYLTQYLTFLGIKKEYQNSFIGIPLSTDEDEPEQLNNMKIAAETFMNKVNNNAKVFIQVDSDTDGFTSSSILISYMKKRWPQLDVIYHLHKGKEHGIVLESIPEDRELIIIPDAGSNDFKQQEELTKAGKTVIVLDHHEVNENVDTGAIIVNNQISPMFENKDLSGAGIVYMFLKYLDKYFFKDKLYIYYRDLAAIGIIADAMNMNTLGNNFLAYYGLNHINNQFIKELAIKQSRGIKDPEHLTKMDVAFYIAPVINGCIRSGSEEDKSVVFRAMVEENCEESFISTWRGVVRNENLYEMATRLATNAKSRQDAAKKKGFEYVCDLVRKNGWDKHNLLIIPLDEVASTKLTANLTGLVAMELVKEFNRPVLLLRQTTFEDKPILGGSGRNGSFYELPNLLDEIQKTNLVTYAAGHGNAFGLFITPDKIDELRNYFDSNINKNVFDDVVYEVDYYFHSYDTIDHEMLMEFAKYDSLWGTSIPQPKFAFEFDFTATEVKIMGKDFSSVKIKHDGIDFVVFKDSDLAAQLTNRDGHISCVGRPEINEWMGRTNLQIMIESVEVTDSQSKDLFSLL